MEDLTFPVCLLCGFPPNFTNFLLAVSNHTTHTILYHTVCDHSFYNLTFSLSHRTQYKAQNDRVTVHAV